MERRTFLVGLAAGVAGCLGGDASGGSTAETDGENSPSATPTGAPTTTASPTPPRSTVTSDPGSTPGVSTPPPVGSTPFETIEVEGTAVPLVPIDVAYDWYRDDAARFVDARGETSYERSHVEGAVHSPARDPRPDDPVDSWPTDAPIVCYCGCPHHLSSMRAAALISNGYTRVYALDEGFWEWQERGYPIEGLNAGAKPRVRVVEGVTDPADAGETAWARHPPSDQREATRIGPDGSYRLELKFWGLSPDAVLTVETPSYRVSDTLSALVGDAVTPADA